MPFSLILLCFFLDPFHCKNSFSSVPFLLHTNHFQFIWRPFTSTWNQPKLWKQLPTSEGNLLERDSSICSTQLLFQTNSFAALVAASRGIISHLILLNGFIFLVFVQLIFKFKISHTKIFQKKNSATKPGVTNVIPLLSFNLHLHDILDDVQLLSKDTGNYYLTW